MPKCACNNEFQYDDQYREHRIECPDWLGDIKDPDHFASLIEQVWEEGGAEEGHEDADDLMLVLLRRLGYSRAADFISKQNRWFA